MRIKRYEENVDLSIFLNDGSEEVTGKKILC